MRDFTPDSLDRLLIVIFPKQRYRPFRKPHGARTISGVFAPLFAQFMTADTLHHTPLVILRISLNLCGYQIFVLKDIKRRLLPPLHAPWARFLASFRLID
jgi:hypothetical protein